MGTTVLSESVLLTASAGMAEAGRRQFELVSAKEFWRDPCKLGTFFCKSGEFWRIGVEVELRVVLPRAITGGEVASVSELDVAEGDLGV